ncbi:Scr1 family TA system antitoxin-like transcriptional regulator [Streptomyces sp. NPDC087263]|uniref:Scr1 family TA system antitoxin-like transcriptional regulator n=1 Tax=Streptomyces sp. NPDC087263 TaxID=3365773 RepID=UPI0037F28DD8
MLYGGCRLAHRGHGPCRHLSTSGQRPICTVQLDTHHGCDFLDAQAQLAKYRTVLDRMEALALKPAPSRDLINTVIRSL